MPLGSVAHQVGFLAEQSGLALSSKLRAGNHHAPCLGAHMWVRKDRGVPCGIGNASPVPDPPLPADKVWVCGGARVPDASHTGDICAATPPILCGEPTASSQLRRLRGTKPLPIAISHQTAHRSPPPALRRPLVVGGNAAPFFLLPFSFFNAALTTSAACAGDSHAAARRCAALCCSSLLPTSSVARGAPGLVDPTWQRPFQAAEHHPRHTALVLPP